jgi:hypothetical protein
LSFGQYLVSSQGVRTNAHTNIFNVGAALQEREITLQDREQSKRGTGGLTMADQMQLYDTSEKQSSNNTGKAKRKWENGFQRWSNRHSADGGSSFGCCGFGSMCDYCDDNSYGRPCVRSLNAMIREKRLKIDYEKTGYEEVWEGIFDNG